MDRPSALYYFREWLTGVAFTIYLLLAGMTKDEFWAEQDRQALQQVLETNGVGGVMRLRNIAQALVDYRNKTGALHFQLEKADTYLREMELALKGERSEPDIFGND